MCSLTDSSGKFQSTLPRRERLQPLSHSATFAEFQSTLPRRERPSWSLKIVVCRYFNPRSREGSDILTSIITLRQNLFQSTLPRRERHSSKMITSMSGAISIHAPAKGATSSKMITSMSGAISIHAPAKGATPKHEAFHPIYRFQSTLPRRERPKIRSHSKKSLIFQSTLPRRERLYSNSINRYFPCHFNPRSREGSDDSEWTNTVNKLNFNPRSREGSDTSPFSIFLFFTEFQSTLPRRERPEY